jgi:hypothetical protein
MAKASKTAIIGEYEKTKNIRKTAEALGIQWHEAKRALDDAQVDLYYRGKGIRYQNQEAIKRAA